MGVNFKEALTYFRRDTGWKSKFAVLSLIVFINSLIAVAQEAQILILPLALFSSGFYILLTHNLIQEHKPVVPDFDIERIFVNSLKFFGAYIIYILGLMAIMFAVGVAFALLGIIFGAIAAAAKNPAFYITMPIVYLLIILPIIAISLYVMFLIQLLKFRYAETLSFQESLNVKRLAKIFNANWAQYVLLFLLMLFVIFSVSLVYYGAPIYDNKPVLIFAMLIQAGLNTLFTFVFYNLISQVYKQSLAKLDNDEPRLETLQHKMDNFDYKVIAVLLGIAVISLIASTSMPTSINSPLGKTFSNMEKTRTHKSMKVR